MFFSRKATPTEPDLDASVEGNKIFFDHFFKDVIPTDDSANDISSSLSSRVASIDDKQVTLLGFQAAGWDDYRKALEAKSTTVYTTTHRIMSKDQSIYWTLHEIQELKKKSQEKKKDPRSVSSALVKVGDILTSLEESETRRAIVTHIIEGVLQNDKNVGDIMVSIETSEKPSEAMLTFLINETFENDPEIYSDEAKSESINLTGYALVSLLRDDADLERCLKGRDKAKFKLLSEWISYVNLDTRSEDLQMSLASSKSMIADTLQRNLTLIEEDKPLVPIDFVICSDGSDGSTPFYPEWKRATNKIGHVLTNVEVRMAYKLMKEVDDVLINWIMEQTVSFHKKTKSGFERIPSPWAEDRELWANRQRSRGKLAYCMREEESLQPWIRALKALAVRVSLSISSSRRTLEI